MASPDTFRAAMNNDPKAAYGLSLISGEHFPLRQIRPSKRRWYVARPDNAPHMSPRNVRAASMPRAPSDERPKPQSHEPNRRAARNPSARNVGIDASAPRSRGWAFSAD